jgi:hypothetical protein
LIGFPPINTWSSGPAILFVSYSKYSLTIGLLIYQVVETCFFFPYSFLELKYFLHLLRLLETLWIPLLELTILVPSISGWSKWLLNPRWQTSV